MRSCWLMVGIHERVLMVGELAALCIPAFTSSVYRSIEIFTTADTCDWTIGRSTSLVADLLRGNSIKVEELLAQHSQDLVNYNLFFDGETPHTIVNFISI